MAGTDISSLVSTVANPSTASKSSTTGDAGVKATIASNFDTFLKLLTTQLKNQNPLDPLDTNQFTQQLVQFASVEQQINMNTQLTTLVSLQKATQATQAMSYLGATATVDGTTAPLSGGKATWNFASDKPATGTINIKSSTGQTVYTGTFPLNAGAQTFSWDGRSNNGVMNRDGAYTLSITAKDASGSTVAISSEVRGTVDAVDLTQNPPVLTIGGQSFTLDKIKQVVRPGL
ncbi:MAG: flagellar basal-body rod modification protein FlgD [Hyphomicrobiales bacterium]|nr:flagellar basal-body rod modification protein FlgD [Hyphomicrobiales bacterium]